MGPVLLVDVLDHGLARLARGQVEIDVGPLATLLGEEALEEQLHAHGVDGGDGQRMADGAVRCGAAPLAEDAPLAGEARDVPDDQEVAGQIELGDDGELVLELAAHAGREWAAVACPRTREAEPAQPGDLALASGDGIAGEAVAQVLEAEGAALRGLVGRAQPGGAVGEAPRHQRGRAKGALSVGEQPSSGFVEGGLVEETGKGVEQTPPLGARNPHVAPRDHGQPGALGEGDAEAALSLELAVEGACDTERAVSTAEDPDQPVHPTAVQMATDGNQGGEARRVLLQLLPGGVRPALGGVALGHGEQPGQVAVAVAALGQQHQSGPCRLREFGADQGAEPRPSRGCMEARGSVEAIAVG